MKKISKFLLVVGLMLATLLPAITPTNTYADATSGDLFTGNCDRNMLGLVSWDCNVVFRQGDLGSGIWGIAANVLTDISVIAAYLVIGYVIYGGYLYMFSSGDPNKVAAGKKTLTQALIGLAIVMLSSVILNAIRMALGANFTANCLASGALPDECYTKDTIGTMVTNAIQWVIGVGGVVSAVFIVIGAVGYVTSAGDPGKLQKAKNTIIYALIGLAVVALAEVITATVSNIIRDANKTSFINQTTIAKELHEKNY